MKLFSTLTAGFAALALMTGAANAAGYIFFDGIDGESSAAAGDEHEIEYDIVAAKMVPLKKYGNVTLKRGYTSSAIEQLVKNKTVIPSVIIEDDSTGEPIRYELERVLITSYQLGAMSLNFSEIKVIYIEQGPDSSAADVPTEEVAFYYNKISR